MDHVSIPANKPGVADENKELKETNNMWYTYINNNHLGKMVNAIFCTLHVRIVYMLVVFQVYLPQ